MTLKNCFGKCYQPMDERSTHGLFVFPNMEKALFDWPIVLQHDVKAKYRLISRKLFWQKVFFSA